ncbi:peptidase S41 [marine bacterium AO1-C]|nr:peptidase S41 [marine bacterium AO1-C]
MITKKHKIMGIALILTVSGLFAFKTITNDKYFEIQKNLDIFATLFKEVNTYYVDEIDPSKLMKTGVDAMLKSLDPYTNYIPEEDLADYRTMTTGQYGGIGATIGNRNGKTLVIMPYEGFPAYKAGLKIGDEIVAINGIALKTKTTTQVSKLLKGAPNTPLTLKIKRVGKANFDVTLKRQTIQIDNVPYYDMVASDVGYIQLTDFTQGASREVRKALYKLKNKGAKKVVLDLRGNPGGLLSEAINISNLFINRNMEVVKTKGKVKEINQTYRALNRPYDINIPLVVLTDKRSASASEIVAGVIQDYDRGVLVGQNTFGKGLVQTTRPLAYNAKLKVTTAKYYIPSGRCIQALDYSQHNADGSAKKFPDSLKTAFKTKNGRTVYDGNGLAPDVLTKEKDYSPIVNSLLDKGLLFDYANIYASKHPTIANAKDFKLTDAEYAAFVKWVKSQNYDYETEVENSLKGLEKTAKDEQYYGSIKGELSNLKNKVSHNKEQDLATYKKDVKHLLEVEIASRYYLHKGLTKVSFREDAELKAALKLFENMNDYKQALTITKKAKR